MGYVDKIFFHLTSFDQTTLKELLNSTSLRSKLSSIGKIWQQNNLKGSEIFNRKVGRNLLIDDVLEMVVAPDFRNRYNLVGFCSINPETIDSAVWCNLQRT
jgi:hypothetical protein